MKYENNTGIREQYVLDVDLFNELIEKASYGRKVVDEYTKGCLSTSVVLEARERFVSFRTREFTIDEEKNKVVRSKLKACTFYYDLTGEGSIPVAPAKVARMFNKIYRPFDLVEESKNENSSFYGLFSEYENGKLANTAKPVLWFNQKYNCTEIDKVYGYDVNSSYGYELSKEFIPDTYKMRVYNKEIHERKDFYVKEGEVGFLLDSDLTMVGEGYFANIICPLMKNPYADFVKKQYEIKRTTKDENEKKIAKFILNCGVGLFQKHNPLIRAFVIHNANKRIQDLINKYRDIAVLANTDSFYSTKKIEELEQQLGDGLGQFKLEVNGEKFRLRGVNYQIPKKKICYRGVIGQKFVQVEDYNILTDKIPTDCGLRYLLDTESKRIIKNPNFKEEI